MSIPSMVLLFCGGAWGGQALGSLPSFTEYLLCAGVLWILQGLAFLSCHPPSPPPPPDHSDLPLSSPANRKRSRRGQESWAFRAQCPHNMELSVRGEQGLPVYKNPKDPQGWCLGQAWGQPLGSGGLGGASSISASKAQTVRPVWDRK